MRTYTSFRNGNWASSSTWTPRGVPGAGDLAIIKHRVTATADATIGDGTASTVLHCVAGSLVVQACKLTIRGDATFGGYNSGNVRLNLKVASATGRPAGIELDGNRGVSPVVSWGYDSLLQIVGTASDRCFIRTKSGTLGNPGRFDPAENAARYMHFDVSYCDFARLGDPSNHCFRSGISRSNTLPSGWTLPPAKLSHCTIDNCSAFYIIADDGADDVQIIHNRWTNPVITNGIDRFIRINCDSAAISTGTRLVDHNRFYGSPGQFVPRDITFTNNYFHEAPYCSGEHRYSAKFDGNFVRKSTDTVTGWDGDLTNNFFLAVGSAGGTTHMLLGQDKLGSPTLVHNNVCQSMITNAGSAWFGDTEGNSSQGTSTSDTLTLTNNLVIPPQGGGSIPLLYFNCNISFARFNIQIFEHNTVCTNSGSPVMVGATLGQKSNTIKSFKSNLFVNSGTSTGVYVNQTSGVSQSKMGLDALPAANASHNCWTGLGSVPSGQWSAIKGDTDIAAGTIYWLPMSGSRPPGANDVHANPSFVDSTRDLGMWGRIVHGTDGTVFGALALIQADPTLTKTDLIPWVQVGFAPSNSALHNAAHDGTNIGAIPFAQRR